MKKKHILVVDDEEELIRAIKLVLKANNYTVSTANNGQEALIKIFSMKKSSCPIDLLITDIRMPKLSGLELIDELHAQNISIPILIITGYSDNNSVNELVSRSKEYITKPIRSKELIDRIKKIFTEIDSAMLSPLSHPTYSPFN